MTANKSFSWPQFFLLKIFGSAILFLLLYSVFVGTSSSIDSQMQGLGNSIWSDYQSLQADATAPTCDPSLDIDSRVNQLEAEFNANLDPDDLFPETFNRNATYQSVKNRLQVCQDKHAEFARTQELLTSNVLLFKEVQTFFSEITLFSANNARTVLLLLLMCAAIITTLEKHHIAFRPIRSEKDYRISIGAQLVAHGALTLSTYRFYQTSPSSDVMLMLIGFGALAAISLYQMINKPKDLNAGGSLGHGLLSIPIYVYMLLITIGYFIYEGGNPASLAIRFEQMMSYTDLYTKFALFIWIGMLLKQTHLGQRVFDIFKPWRLPPEILAFLAVAVMAVPTAYTGASGIIIIAMGVVVYQELRRVGTRRQLALAATAMTGSSGVVLSPCLLVIGIAMLNDEVTSDELFTWGKWVFLLTIVMFVLFAMLTRREPMNLAKPKEAAGPCLAFLKNLLPYALIMLGVGLAYALLLDAYLDEFSAPIILPVMMIALIIYERNFADTARAHAGDSTESAPVDEERGDTSRTALSNSVSTSAVHIGALLILMGASFALAGVIEEAGMAPHFPEGMDSIWITMGILVVFLVFIGMIMDPFGALVLVTSAVAPVAYQQGINPIHFWMVCLVAFELGYLTPPVSLNHLLTRQVVGEEEARLAVEETRGESFYYRHEKILLPLMVMGVSLVIVAFGPLLVGY